MKKSTRNYIVFIALFVLVVLQAISGFVLWQVLPSGGYQGGRGLSEGNTFLWDRHTWIDLHAWITIILAVIVVIHIVLHWKWIAYMTKQVL